MKFLSCFKKHVRDGIISEKIHTFVPSNHNSDTLMNLRYIFLSFLMTVFLAPVWGQGTVGSNIASKTVLSDDSTQMFVQRVYDNGLGDVVEEVLAWPGSTLPDVVVRHEYDEYRRRTCSWLPVTSSGGGFVNGSMIASLAQSQYGDTAPFSRTEYDGFLPSQPSALYKAGAQWQGNGKKVSVTYSEYVGAGMYSPGDGYMYINADTTKFLCTHTVDEDGCWEAEYTDLNGRVMISETSQGKTYYMYNLRGDITYVIPPALSSYLISQYGYESDYLADTDGMIQKYAYIYRYDNQRHCIYKKLPGCDPVYYVYDRAGNCILTQDGNLRQRGEWAYSIPDKFGRPSVSGICRNTVSYSEEPLHPVHVYAEYDGTSAATGGYTVYGLTLNQQTLYAASYYDGYSFIGHHGVPSSLTASSVPGFSVDTSLGHGLQTGSATAVLNGSSVTGYTYSAMYYDSRYNVSQVKATNHLGGTDVTSTSYSYTGKPLSVNVQQTIPGTSMVEEEHTYTYDDADRMASYTLSVSHGGDVASSTMTYGYDALGRLSSTTRPFTTAVEPDVTYTYDLHGWPTGITTHSFSEEMFYAGGPGTPRYNGNISSVRWTDKKSTQKRGYKFTYDDANRLSHAAYGEGDALTANSGRFSEDVQYDAHGNVTGIARYGKISSYGYGLMDSLTLSYDGNRLTGVTEAAADYDVTGSFEYKRARGSQYLYDSNGSLVADKSRGIVYITYDVNGNPSGIYFTNGNVTKYLYSASGQKLRSVYYTAMPYITRTFGVQPPELEQWQTQYADSTDYLLGGSLVMKNGRIDKCLFNGGYARAMSTGSTTDRFVFYYYNKDHLGNNREVVDVRGRLHQVTNYYPCGAPYADPAALSGVEHQPYKYNGKELDTMHGLNTYDYGARQYDPILARWDRVDPLCEKYYNVSPYVYCENNPVKFIDLDGMKDTTYVEGKDTPISPIPGTETPIYNNWHPNNRLAYNCHSFAWENCQGDPEDPRNSYPISIGAVKWDNNPDNNMDEYSQLDFNAKNIVDDRVIYYIDSNNDSQYNYGEEIIHSAIVYSVDLKGNTTSVISKMGQEGISINHPRAPGFYDNYKGYSTSRAYFRKKQVR